MNEALVESAALGAAPKAVQPEDQQSSPNRYRSDGAGLFFCVGIYKDLAPLEPSFGVGSIKIWLLRGHFFRPPPFVQPFPQLIVAQSGPPFQAVRLF